MDRSLDGGFESLAFLRFASGALASDAPYLTNAAASSDVLNKKQSRCSGEISLKELSWQLSFADPNAFQWVLKKTTGLSPSASRSDGNGA